MQRHARHQYLSRVGLFGIGIMMLALWGCESGSETSQPMSATTLNIVFPRQAATLLEHSRPKTTESVHRIEPHFFARLLDSVTRFGSVSVAYAQVIPSSIGRLMLTITGPDMTPIVRDIDRATGRITVDVPVGNSRVFEVEAFPSGASIPTFIGSTTADILPTGTSVTINMQPFQLAVIEVTPPNPQIAAGTTQQFTATGILTDGTRQDVTSVVTWESSTPAVAAISNAAGNQGLATSVAPGGPITISAIAGTITGTTQLTVTPALLVSITVTPPNPQLAAGLTQQFTATGLFTDNSTQNLTTQVTWQSSNPAIATISNATGSQGLATGLVPGGPLTISATAPPTLPTLGGPVTGTAQLTVVTPVVIVECITGAPGGDLIFRGFYIPNYPDNSLSRVDLFFSADDPGDYTFSLDLHTNTYDGVLLGTDTAAVTLSGNIFDRQLTTFVFPGVTVAAGTTVTFAIQQVSGPTSTVFYAVPTPDNPSCPVLETEDTIPPLSTFRRNGVKSGFFVSTR